MSLCSFQVEISRIKFLDSHFYLGILQVVNTDIKVTIYLGLLHIHLCGYPIGKILQIYIFYYWIFYFKLGYFHNLLVDASFNYVNITFSKYCRYTYFIIGILISNWDISTIFGEMPTDSMVMPKVTPFINWILTFFILYFQNQFG